MSGDKGYLSEDVVMTNSLRLETLQRWSIGKWTISIFITHDMVQHVNDILYVCIAMQNFKLRTCPHPMQPQSLSIQYHNLAFVWAFFKTGSIFVA